jgi:outer membrane protein assembly factor BamE (lipoprotein component of BamABCDE complex)
MSNKHQVIILTLLLSLLSGCVHYSRDSGVENLWRQPQAFTSRVTTSQQVLTALGPPSQVLSVGKQTVYYYLKEQVTRQGLVLLIYNETTEVSIFDRAIFFFNEQGILVDFSYSQLPRNTE